MPVQNTRKREKKIVNEPMEVKQYGPSQFTKNYAQMRSGASGASTAAARTAQGRGNEKAVRAVERLMNKAFNSKSTNTSATKAKAAYDDGNGTTFLNAKPQKQIKDQQNNKNVYGRVTAVNGKAVKKKKGR